MQFVGEYYITLYELNGSWLKRLIELGMYCAYRGEAFC